MYLSKLVLPLLDRKNQRLLANPYRLHQAIMFAFPHREQGGAGRLLFRHEPEQDQGYAKILVQSEAMPNWEAPTLIEHISLAEVPPVKRLQLKLDPGMLLRFRLRANPTVKKDGKRRALLREEELLNWLDRKLTAAGFKLQTAATFSEGQVKAIRSNKGPEGTPMVFNSVRFEGVVQVKDEAKALKSLDDGLGSAKAFGFGLLSLMPLR